MTSDISKKGICHELAMLYLEKAYDLSELTSSQLMEEYLRIVGDLSEVYDEKQSSGFSFGSVQL